MIDRPIPDSPTRKSTLRITLTITVLVVCAALSLIGYAAFTTNRTAAIEREAQGQWRRFQDLGRAVDGGDLTAVTAGFASGPKEAGGPAFLMEPRTEKTKIVRLS